ncbi:MAG: hypothetical protein Q7K54_05200 [Candidatus Parcubacteria bacterium]|nr:hypothetical protein [Candidatus Parcubacteria bacterium]
MLYSLVIMPPHELSALGGFFMILLMLGFIMYFWFTGLVGLFKNIIKLYKIIK